MNSTQLQILADEALAEANRNIERMGRLSRLAQKARLKELHERLRKQREKMVMSR